MTCQRKMKMRTYQMNKLYLDKLYIPLRGGIYIQFIIRISIQFLYSFIQLYSLLKKRHKLMDTFYPEFFSPPSFRNRQA
jgi:hypothetical protein